VGEINRTLKQKAVHELREYLVISFYLFVVFSLFVVYTSVILAEHHIDFALHGFALINALALAKVMLVAQELHLADQFRDARCWFPFLGSRSYGESSARNGWWESFSDRARSRRRHVSRQVVSPEHRRPRRRFLEGNLVSRRVAVRRAGSLFWVHGATASLRPGTVGGSLFPTAPSAEFASHQIVNGALTP
jgi:hypothetical protein